MYKNKIIFCKFKEVSNVKKLVTNIQIKKLKKIGKIKKIFDNEKIKNDIVKGTLKFYTANEVYLSKNFLIQYQNFLFKHNFFLRNWNELSAEEKNAVIILKEDIENIHVKLVISGIFFSYLFYITKNKDTKMLIDDGSNKVEYKEISIKQSLTPCEIIKKGEEKKFKGTVEYFTTSSKNKIINNYLKQYNYQTEHQLKDDIQKKCSYQEIEEFINDDITLND